MLRPAVFLDRDGVLNQEAGYIKQIDDLLLMPRAAEAVRQLNDRGIFCCLASNQAGAARGYYSADHIDALTERLQTLLAAEAGAHLDGICNCISLSPEEGGINPDLTYYSTWRKPNTGMLVAAAWRYDLDLKRSYMVGDKATDIDLAHNAGCKGVLVTSGYGAQVQKGTYQHPVHPEFIAADLCDAVTWILQHFS
ncbi:MAG: D-glycero-alpha-D-manno-heptose-1,7-bisphosphate 7-phosphatase [Pseudanabaenaceae cyanobacterium]|jgi:D-glycero-D-manno-heptose 1,7-bisphosphate phosphatase